MNQRLSLFPFPHIVFDDTASSDTQTIDVENKKYTIDEAIGKIEEIKNNIKETKSKISESLEHLNNDDIDLSINSLEEAENIINCPRCKNKLIIEQAKLKVLDLACSLDDESACNTEKTKMKKELEDMLNEYMEKVESIKIERLKSLRQVI